MPQSTVGFIGRGSFFKEICKHLKDNGYNAYNLMDERARAPRVLNTIVNYGLQGDHLRIWMSTSTHRHVYPLCQDIKNKSLFGDKYGCCEAVRSAGVPVPECKSGVDAYVNTQDWIVKPLWSFGGRGIVPYTGQRLTARQYLQKRITNRRYELRVHAVSWLPKDKWLVAKRIHPDGDAQLTWNYHQGGTFSNIEQNESNTGVFKRAKEYAAKAINALGLQFGAVDFIVQNGSGELPLWFLEVNMAPGFTTDRTREFYFIAFEALAVGQSAAVPEAPPRTTATPPPAATREMPSAAVARSLTMTNKMKIISWLTNNNGNSEELISYIHTLR